MLDFKFMVHDKWANVLFLHWRVPPRLEAALQDHCGSFILDRTPDGSAWIGLVLLTEQNVGPSFLRSSRTCITHHGVNVRTYIQGQGGQEGEDRTRGIHFASLECNDRFTSFGANLFGMPYKVAAISREYGLEREWDSETEDEMCGLLAPCDKDDFLCHDTAGISRMKSFQLSSLRSRRGSSLWNLLCSFFGGYETPLHTTTIKLVEDSGEKKNERRQKQGSGGETSYEVECEWDRCLGANMDDTQAELAQFLMERYFVYTKKYGINWRGEVEHEPWPVEKASLKLLDIRNIQEYEPKSLQSLIAYMANTKPDIVLFSPGVGPVAFNMFKPI